MKLEGLLAPTGYLLKNKTEKGSQSDYNLRNKERKERKN